VVVLGAHPGKTMLATRISAIRINMCFFILLFSSLNVEYRIKKNMVYGPSFILILYEITPPSGPDPVQNGIAVSFRSFLTCDS
jgi:hypothetical protein